jgi:hypothetical protein
MTKELYQKARNLTSEEYRIMCKKGATMSNEEYAIFCARVDLYEIMLSEGDVGINENVKLRKIRCNFLYANCKQYAHYFNAQEKSYYCRFHNNQFIEGENRDYVPIKCDFNHKNCKVPPSYANDLDNHYCFIHSVMIEDKKYNFPGRF